MDERPRILIVEDEPAIADTLLYALKTEGFAPEWCATGRAGLAALAAKPFAFVVLDVGLPDGTGFEVCKQIRVHSNVPVLFLTARNSELDRVLGLELGGDDYLVKPFSPRELTARVKAILRRTNGGSGQNPNPVGTADKATAASSTVPAPVSSPPLNSTSAATPTSRAPGREFEVDDERCTVRYRGVLLELTRYEFRLLRVLAAKPGRVFTRDQLMTAAWEDPGASLDRTVDAHIKTLRAKLRAVADDADPIQTHRGLGYSLRESGAGAFASVKIRTAIFGVYVAASAVGFVVLMYFVLGDVRLRYVESMRRTLGDTAAFLATFAAQEAQPGSEAWAQKLALLPPNAELLRVFACDASGRVIFDSAHGHDLGKVYTWPMRGGGRAASENYSLANVAEVDGELRVAAPVRYAQTQLGWVGVGRPLATVAEGVTRARRELLWLAGLVALSMLAIGWWIASRLTHSLERLTAYAQAVRAGQAAEPPKSQAAEIDALSRSFEEMRVALEGKAYVERYTQALAHEFKAPLSAIRGAAELLAEKSPEPDRARFIANLRAETERLRMIVDRLLELAALEGRRKSGVTEELDLRELVAEVIAASRAQAVSARVSLLLIPSVGTMEETWPWLRGERFLLAQAIGNLVQNALEFTPPDGQVMVSLHRSGERMQVVVEDSGPGVPDYAVERIFDRFYSLPRPSTGRKSSGLGLSIVREIARLHGGEIALENRPEGGARATLSLHAV